MPKGEASAASDVWLNCGCERRWYWNENNGGLVMKTEKKLNPREAPPATITSILTPIDFSSASTKALVYAAALAKQFGAKITPLFVVELPEVVGLFQLLLDDDEMKEACRKKLAKFIRKAHIPAELLNAGVVRKGRPHHEITEAARTLKVDLIVISTHGYTGVNRALLGSVTERVVRGAPCPVLVVREHEREFIRTPEQKGVGV
jgi:universal stress protein A